MIAKQRTYQVPPLDFGAYLADLNEPPRVAGWWSSPCQCPFCTLALGPHKRPSPGCSRLPPDFGWALTLYFIVIILSVNYFFATLLRLVWLLQNCPALSTWPCLASCSNVLSTKWSTLSIATQECTNCAKNVLFTNLCNGSTNTTTTILTRKF